MGRMKRIACWKQAIQRSLEYYQNDHKEKNMREDRIRKTRVRRQGTRDTKGE